MFFKEENVEKAMSLRKDWKALPEPNFSFRELAFKF